MAKDKAGLYVDTQDLFRLLYETQFEIPKRDRIALTNRMLDRCCVVARDGYSYKDRLKYKIDRLN